MALEQASVSIQDVVDYIIGQFADEDGSLSILKLQKLLYYAQSWNLAFDRGPLFAGKFQAWVHGPVNRQVYDRFKDTHSLFSPLSQRDIRSSFDPEALPAEVKNHVADILEAYGSFSGTQLENMTHEEAPWVEARGELKTFERCEIEIDEGVMRDFYANLLKAEVKVL